MKGLYDITNTSTVTEFVEAYIDHGLGSMTKNDFEVWIFSRIIQMPKYKGKSNYELSIAMHIPESKIKRLRYEAALKAPIKSEEAYKKDVQKILKNASLRCREKKIVFQVEDVMLKMYITSILKRDGRTIDSSFNPELVVVHTDDFQYLAQAVCSNEELKNVMDEAKKAVKDDAKKEVTWNDIMGWVVEGTVSSITNGAVSAAIDLSPMGIVKTIKKLLKT